ncbi:hypothetical protein GCM10029978_083420 [Actinoallomurus acanthiterrae]
MAETAIAGLGMTELGKVYGPSSRRFAAQAVRAAAADAALALTDLDGLIMGTSLTGTLARRDARLLVQINGHEHNLVTCSPGPLRVKGGR